MSFKFPRAFDQKLGKKDATICELRYPKPPTDLTTLKVIKHWR